MLEGYKTKYPKEYAEFNKVLNNDYSVSDELFKDFVYEAEATRKTVGKFINLVSKENGCLFAGSADLTASTNVKGTDNAFDVNNRFGRNINFGVREHAMGAISNGMALHNVRCMTGAFFVFSDYMKPAIRMAALMNLPQIFVFTHDSIAVGEDGPTHEPIEQIAGLRAIPNLDVFRPSDSKETIEVLKLALNRKETPAVILLTRQNLPVLGDVNKEEILKGAFFRLKQENPVGTLVSTGSEVSLSLDVAHILEEKGYKVNVVEMTSTRMFDQLSKEEKEELIPSAIPSMFVEMSSPFGLKAYAKEAYAIDRFGASGNVSKLLPYFGFTKEQLAEAFLKEIKK